MYLKSIEVHGFKSFANKIVFDFHNGITGIVGPNGSGKSNVADAVRWVLGEQSAKQLRGASMQDIIFAGTENRKPVSYAYVAITLDNADHVLPVEYEEVTVARRVYRSGESEYLLNGNVCRLKDVYELFYDTGIGKEGYSIIGQGQIERILSGKPEERRELFDEAAGIVKFKRRKATTQKKLEHERENLVRIDDILSELERQVGPLEQQAQKAKEYIRRREELKAYEVNLFLLDMEQNEAQLKELEEKTTIAEGQLSETDGAYERIRSEYDRLEQSLERLEAQITKTRDDISNTTVQKGKLEGEMNVLLEQIRTARMSREHFLNRQEAVFRDREERLSGRLDYEKQKKQLEKQLAEVAERRKAAAKALEAIRDRMSVCSAQIEQGKNDIIDLLNQKASIKGKQQRFDTMLEQAGIRRAQLNQRKLRKKSEEADLETMMAGCEAELRAAEARLENLADTERQLAEERQKGRRRQEETRAALDRATADYHKAQSRLESLRNIAERYDGYGNSIRRVMEKKTEESGIHGVVADLIKVEKKYETAIETALGGSIQNIVTEDEETAKRMVRYLKENKFGRATFLPLTSVTGRGQGRNERALAEEGVIGMANTLVQTAPAYEGVMSYLLGRILVVDQVDHAVALAQKFHYSLHIVTLEGEHLSPGGSISGGAFRNSSNLLGRKREIEELAAQADGLAAQGKRLKRQMEDLRLEQDALRRRQEENETAKQEAILQQNTAQMNLERAVEQKEERERAYASLAAEEEELAKQQRELDQARAEAEAELADLQSREAQTNEETAAMQAEAELQAQREQEAVRKLSEIQLEEANLSQQSGFIQENLERIDSELARLDEELQQIDSGAKEADEDAAQKERDVQEIKKAIAASEEQGKNLETELAGKLAQKEEMAGSQKGFFQKREELSEQRNALDKELFRLNGQKEKLEEAKESQTDYMWTEYELTPHSALELRDESYGNPSEIRGRIRETKGAIRELGDVNVNAIEEYREVSERYGFLKAQHDDLVEAEQTLLGIIEELDTGMRRQFTEKFQEIQAEFDKAFQELFGGGKGTLELVEDEDILECGIRIIAHPPGKKLQNMMQLSGGEKALTAIALLFAIQNLKPSPFCLLDEIEAALDDSNVNRFAKYLNKLTKNTQFIVITHRRGTMAAADRLYGITMQEKGVSTLVSVSLIEHDLDK